MDKRNRRRTLAPLAGVLGSAGGTLGVFALLFAMNGAEVDSGVKTGPETVAFDVKTPKPPPIQKKKTVQKKIRKNKTAKTLAPAPVVGAALSGQSFALPQFDMGTFAGGQGTLEDGGITGKDLVMSANAVDSPPQPAPGNKSPEYPAAAVRDGVTGTVVLKLLVTSAGKPRNVRVLKATPPGVFDQAAIQAVREWVFEPATYNGEPVTMEATLPIHFERG